jgi:hypothetical protein
MRASEKREGLEMTRKDRLEELGLHVSGSMNDETFLIFDEVWKEYSILHFHGNEVPHVDEYLFGIHEYEGIDKHEKHFLQNFDLDNGVPDRTYETEEGYWSGEAPDFENTYQIQKNIRDRENYKY